ncbi:MAG: phosphotransferase, partial [Bdellovibrionales bacterium]|nr:phosphotransferase [Bdellovibrionales bacterium]
GHIELALLHNLSVFRRGPSPMMEERQQDQTDQRPREQAPPSELTESALQTREAVFFEQMRSYLEDSLQQHYPDVYSESVRVEALESSGLTATVFSATDVEGNKFFLKVRPLSKDESLETLGSSGDFAKEKHFTEVGRANGVAMTRVFNPSHFSVEDFAPEFSNLELKYIGAEGLAGSRPFTLMIQDFVAAEPFSSHLSDQTLAISVMENFGRELSKLNAVPASGYGSTYDGATKSFKLSQEEFLLRYNADQKIEELEEKGILSPEDSAKLRSLIQVLHDKDLPAVYCHFDPNPGNYLVDPDTGAVKAVIDFDSSGAAPWQYQLAKAIGVIEASSFYIDQEDKAERVKALLRGYGKSGAELRENLDTINAFRALDALQFMHTMFVDYQLEYAPAVHQEIARNYRCLPARKRCAGTRPFTRSYSRWNEEWRYASVAGISDD